MNLSFFGFQAIWLIFLFGDKLKRKECIYFHLCISNLCSPTFHLPSSRQFILHEHSVWKYIIDIVTQLEEVPAQKVS